MSKQITVIVTAFAVAGFMLFVFAVNTVGARAQSAVSDGDRGRVAAEPDRLAASTASLLDGGLPKYRQPHAR